MDGYERICSDHSHLLVIQAIAVCGLNVIVGYAARYRLDTRLFSVSAHTPLLFLTTKWGFLSGQHSLSSLESAPSRSFARSS